eukprot:CAMPEP_0202090648 /NCGR_PEP_ID=MMETSP0964-20121228/44083_1 /ASSEMBLY_ACC=CAM_ASM_000500 /TAXON_ID=4773 /ORGANISM="Schizochytrium aggregatum, Strain ATCC28209" /LENGTH=501 /DNA_ID=CAMNT_0048658813 /DNA_START=42 /DNA_END=1547 /DNA_ORIENTATION=-
MADGQRGAKGRVARLAQQLCPARETTAATAAAACPFAGRVASCPTAGVQPLASRPASPDSLAGAVAPPEVVAQRALSTDPIKFLFECVAKHPEIFVVDRGNGHKYAVLSDPEMFEDVLTYDKEFGNPVTPNMSVNKNVFQIPLDQLERHEQNAIGGLRRFLLNHSSEIADDVAAKAINFMQDHLGDSGEMDLRDFGQTVFWPMTEALFGQRASYRESNYLLKAFEDIDNYFGKAIKGRKVPQVEDGVKKAYSLFSEMVSDAKKGGQPLGPVMEFYDEVTNREDPSLTAKFSTAAFWGGSGNSVPSTVWAFGLVLADPESKAKAYAEVDGVFANEPNQAGHYNFDKLEYLTAALKETLRLKTFSIAWRQAQHDTVLTSKAGNRYLIPKGMLIGLHFALRHHDPNVHPDPEKFRPERFLGSGSGLSPTVNGHKYAWVPFSAGRHKCSGYSLAMLEIPVIMALAFREYDMELLDPLPGVDFQQAFGVVGPDAKPVRVRYVRRQK